MQKMALRVNRPIDMYIYSKTYRCTEKWMVRSASMLEEQDKHHFSQFNCLTKSASFAPTDLYMSI